MSRGPDEPCPRNGPIQEGVRLNLDGNLEDTEDFRAGVPGGTDVFTPSEKIDSVFTVTRVIRL